MYRPIDHAALWDRLRRHLSLSGPAAASELYQLLSVSPATLSRLRAERRDELLVVGRARATRYAARRAIAGSRDALPVYEIGQDGAAALLGTLHPVAPAGFHFATDTALAGFYPGMPWFLDDLRPSGFLGRLVPAHHPDLGFPRDVRDWSVDQAVVWLASHGSDLVGNLVLGSPAFERSLLTTPSNLVDASERDLRYPALATDVMAAGIPGSSAGGEQPKFLATVRDGTRHTPVLVKFSPPVTSAVGTRIADLLVCEHLAGRAVVEAGLPSARSEVHRHGDRVFLEVERFDRVGARGRRGLVSLRALDGEYVGDGHGWAEVAEALGAQHRIADSCVERVAWLDRFGEWIGNTDRHLGNLSFLFQGGRLGELAPTYDMLPMGYAPRSGEVVDVTLALPRLTASRAHTWVGAWRAALGFWEAVSRHPLVSPEFQAIANANVKLLAAQEPTLERLPR